MSFHYSKSRALPRMIWSMFMCMIAATEMSSVNHSAVSPTMSRVEHAISKTVEKSFVASEFPFTHPSLLKKRGWCASRHFIELLADQNVWERVPTVQPRASYGTYIKCMSELLEMGSHWHEHNRLLIRPSATAVLEAVRLEFFHLHNLEIQRSETCRSQEPAVRNILT